MHISSITNLIKTYWKYLYLPAIFLLVAGSVAGVTTGQWRSLYLLAIAMGSMLLGGWMIASVLIANPLLSRRSTQAGTNALLTTVALLIIVAVVNLFAFRYSVTFDLTENQQFTLFSQSQALVKSLENPVKIWVFDSSPNNRDKELLKNYQRYSNQFSFEFVDPDQKPNLVKEFKVNSQGDVFIEYGDKKQLVQTLINFNQREPLSEIKLTNAIEKIRQTQTSSVYFLQGHGESALNTSKEGLSGAVAGLESKGFKVNPLNLAEKATIPEDADVIVLAGPQRALLKAEVAALSRYQDQGGEVLVMVGAEIDAGLDPWLKNWGATLDRRIVVDVSGAGQMLGLGPAAPIVTRYGEHPITRDFNNGISIFPLSRPIATVKTQGVTAVTLLEASENMLAKTELTQELEYDPTVDLRGPFDLGIALERTPLPSPTVSPSPDVSPSPSPSPDPTPRPKDLKPAKLVVIGNALFATNEWFNEQLNGDIFLNSVQWLANQDEQPLSIRPKEPTNRRLNLTPLQASLVGWLSWIVVPLVGLGLAVFTWWRRQ